MRDFQDSSETRKRSFISAFSISMTVPLRGISRMAALKIWENYEVINKILNITNLYK